jgi:hypothetical protein
MPDTSSRKKPPKSDGFHQPGFSNPSIVELNQQQLMARNKRSLPFSEQGSFGFF